MDKRKKLRIFAIILIVLAFLLEGVYHFKIEPADRNTKQKHTVTKEIETDSQKKDNADSQKDKVASSESEQQNEQTDTKQPAKKTDKKADGQVGSVDQKGQADTQTTANPGSQSKQPQAEAETVVCRIEIECKNIADGSKVTNAAILPYIPKDGVILAQTQRTVTKGSSVYDVLRQVAKENGILVDSDDGYIRGIANIYEFDAGTLSGWMYLVNGKAPNYGCDSYQVQENDVIRWCYTCDLGNDVGGRGN